MQASSLMLLLALGLLSVCVSAQASPSPMEQYLEGIDGEITSMDEAIEKANLLRELKAALDKAQRALVATDGKQKRSLSSYFHKIGNAIKNAGKKVADFCVNSYHTAERDFTKVTRRISFSTAVHNLIPLIDSKMAVDACVTVCDFAAVAVLGPVACVADSMCRFVCDGALATIQSVVG